MDILRSDRGPAETESPLIDAVVERVRERLPADEAEACAAFVRQYYRWVPPEDLAGRSALDLYGMALAHWRLLQQRPPGRSRGPRLQPELRAARLAVDAHGDRDRQRRHAVPRRLDHDRAGPARHRHPPDHPPGDRRPPRRRRPAARASARPAAAASRPRASRCCTPRSTARPRPSGCASSRRRCSACSTRCAPRSTTGRRCGGACTRPRRCCAPPSATADDLRESADYLEWLDENHFTFLGYQEYEVADGRRRRVAAAARRIGARRAARRTRSPPRPTATPPGRERSPRRRGALVLTKASMRATRPPAVLPRLRRRADHRRRRPARRRAALPRPVHHARLLGAHAADPDPARQGRLRARRGPASRPTRTTARRWSRSSTTTRATSSSRSSRDELFAIAMGILAIGERQRVRLFVRRDEFERFVSCLVFLPRDRFNTANRQRVAAVLAEALDAELDEWTLLLSESVLVRIHYLFHTARGAAIRATTGAIEARLVEVTTSWTDELRACADRRARRGGRARRCTSATATPSPPATAPTGSRARRSPTSAAPRRSPPTAAWRWSRTARSRRPTAALRCKLFSAGAPILLSDVLPIFENMGARITDERPYELAPRGAPPLWLYDFGFVVERAGGDRVRRRCASASRRRSSASGAATTRTTQLNRLVLDDAAERPRRDDPARDRPLPAPGRTDARRDRAPARADRLPGDRGGSSSRCSARASTQPRVDAAAEAALEQSITAAIDAVASLDDDRVLRAHLAAITAMTRTDYYLPGADGGPRRRWRSSSTRSGCRCCRRRDRATRSSSTRRASRACTCAAAASRAAACAGRIAARTSAPRCSA